MSLVERKPDFRVSDTNRAGQSQKMVRGLNLRFKEEEELYYLGSENKGADQLRGYHAADLRLCFSHMQKADFLMMRPILLAKLNLILPH